MELRLHVCRTSFCVYVADAGFAHDDGIDSVVRVQHVVCEYI